MILNYIPACEEGPGICALLLTVFSLLLIVASLPLSLVCVVKVVRVTKNDDDHDDNNDGYDGDSDAFSR